MATTVTPGRTAPLLSATLPLICAVAWAHALVEASRRRTTPTRIPEVRLIQPLLERRFTKTPEDDDWPYGRDKLAGSIPPTVGVYGWFGFSDSCCKNAR